MMKISIDGKELKGIIEKVSCNMGKNKSGLFLNKILLIDIGGKLHAYTCTFDSYLQINTIDYISISTGSICIDKEDIKVLLNMKNEVIIEETEKGILIQNGKKIITLSKYDIAELLGFPEVEYFNILKFKECEFQEIISNFSIFTANNDSNKILQSIHFNIDKSRIEALEGHRIITRTIEQKEKIMETGKILIHSTIVSDLKKTLNKKSDTDIIISDSHKFIKVSGENFIYVQKKSDGDFCNIEKLFTKDYDFSFNVDTQKMFEHVKYYADNVVEKSNMENRNIVFNIADTITTYARNTRFEVSDKLEITNFKGKEKDLTIALNPYFILDALKIADDTEVYCTAINNKAPLMIYANKYSFLILPINISPFLLEKMQEIINK